VANDGYGVIRRQGAVTVLDDDPGAGERMAIGDAAAVVQGAADGHLYIPVTLATPAPAAISATYTVNAGSAGTRFTLAKRGTVRFANGTTTAFLDATVRRQATPPTVNTSFTVTLSVPIGAVLGRATGTGTLLAP
jgi:streptogramin lyase